MYRATEQSTDRVVALKKSRVSLRVKRTLLQHEARVLQLLAGYPNVPAVFAYGRVEHFEFLSMQLLHRSLADVVQEKGKLPMARVLDIAGQLVG